MATKCLFLIYSYVDFDLVISYCFHWVYVFLGLPCVVEFVSLFHGSLVITSCKWMIDLSFELVGILGLVPFIVWIRCCFNLVVWWVKYSQFGFFLPFDCSDWLECFSPYCFFDWLSLSLLIVSLSLSPPFDSSVWLVLSLLILLFDWYSPSLASFVWLLLSPYLVSFVWLPLSLYWFLFFCLGCFTAGSSIWFGLKLFDLVWLGYVWMVALFGWLIVIVLTALSAKITHFGWLRLSIGFADSFGLFFWVNL